MLCDDLPERYRVKRILGHGAFGEVLLVADIQTSRDVAIKQLYLPHPGAPLPPAVAQEVSALRQLNHPNIIALLDVIASGCCVYLCQELCCSDLASVLASASHQLPASLTCRIMQQLLSALAACHAQGFMHRDVKPPNILITSSGRIKLADFGLAKKTTQYNSPLTKASLGGTLQQPPAASSGGNIQDTAHLGGHLQQQEDGCRALQQAEGGSKGLQTCHTAAQGTRWYRAPELLLGSQVYGPEVDVWAAGMVFAEVLGLSPFIPGQSDIDQLACMQYKLGSITPEVWPSVSQLPDWHKVSFAQCKGQPLAALLPDAPPAALELLQQLIPYDPQQRLSAAAALQHRYFTAA